MPSSDPIGLFEAPDFDMPGFKERGGWGGSLPNQPPTFGPYQTGLLPEAPISSGPTAFGGLRRRLLGGGLELGARPTQFAGGAVSLAAPGAEYRGRSGRNWPPGGVGTPPGGGNVAPPGAPGAPGDPGVGGATRNPYIYDPSFYTGGSAGQLLQNLIALGGRGGAYDPGGSEFLIRSLSDQLSQDARDRIVSAQGSAEVYGSGDPYLSNYARINATEEAQGDLSRSLAAARAGSAQQNQALLQQVLMALFGRTLQKDPSGGGTDWGSIIAGVGRGAAAVAGA